MNSGDEKSTTVIDRDLQLERAERRIDDALARMVRASAPSTTAALVVAPSADLVAADAAPMTLSQVAGVVAVTQSPVEKASTVGEAVRTAPAPAPSKVQAPVPKAPDVEAKAMQTAAASHFPSSSERWAIGGDTYGAGLDAVAALAVEKGSLYSRRNAIIGGASLGFLFSIAAAGRAVQERHRREREVAAERQAQLEYLLADVTDGLAKAREEARAVAEVNTRAISELATATVASQAASTQLAAASVEANTQSRKEATLDRRISHERDALIRREGLSAARRAREVYAAEVRERQLGDVRRLVERREALAGGRADPEVDAELSEAIAIGEAALAE